MEGEIDRGLRGHLTTMIKLNIPNRKSGTRRGRWRSSQTRPLATEGSGAVVHDELRVIVWKQIERVPISRLTSHAADGAFGTERRG